MRIVAGEFRGRRLETPRGQSTRPTSDRMRETLFNILQHRYPDLFEGARVLDLFAGTGALGIEALSRGAGFCVFVEMAAEARAVIRSNVDMLGLQGRTRIFRRDATRLGPAGTLSPFRLVLVDPPYCKGLGEAAIQAAAAGGWLAAGAILSVEESGSADFGPPAGFLPLDRIESGTTALHLLQYAGED